jgi:hypothetical protein
LETNEVDVNSSYIEIAVLANSRFFFTPYFGVIVLPNFQAKPLQAANLPHIGSEFIDVIKYVGVLKI